jgi:amidase
VPVAAAPAYDPERAPVVAGRELSPWEVLAPSRAISLFGIPAAAVTVGASDEGLPVAVQVVGRPFHEHDVLGVAAALEAAAPRLAELPMA